MSKYSFNPELAVPPLGFSVVHDFTPDEVLIVREEPLTEPRIARWRRCLDQSLFGVGVREDSSQQLAGVGFIVGTDRHMMLVDGTVHSAYREQGLGNVIMSELMGYANTWQPDYLELTYDKASPWLKEGYEKFGFRVVDFAMWHEDSLPAHV